MTQGQKYEGTQWELANVKMLISLVKHYTMWGSCELIILSISIFYLTKSSMNKFTPKKKILSKTKFLIDELF